MQRRADRTDSPRQRIRIDNDWRFEEDDPAGNKVGLLYDVRPQPQGRRGEPTIAPATAPGESWICLTILRSKGHSSPPATAGVVWYRKNPDIPAGDAGKSLFLDIDGAMSYSEVWLNGHFVGG